MCLVELSSHSGLNWHIAKPSFNPNVHFRYILEIENPHNREELINIQYTYLHYYRKFKKHLKSNLMET